MSHHMAKRIGQYEAMFLFPAGAAIDVEGAIKMARGLIEKHGGEVLVIKKWDERRLAYEISGQKRGLYIIAYYRGPGASVSAIDHDVNLSEQILRVLIVKADHLNEQEMNAVEPQPIEKERPARDDRFESDRPARAPRGRREDQFEEESLSTGDGE